MTIVRKIKLSLFVPGLWMLIAVHAVYAQSFDCHLAETDTEWAICNTPELRALDTQTAAAYNQLSAAAAKAGALQFRNTIEQNHSYWIHQQRDACGGDVACLTKAYQSILPTLKEQLPTVPVMAERERMAKRNMTATVTPLCNDLALWKSLTSTLPGAQRFAQTVCANPDLLLTTREIDVLAQKLRPRLPPAWRKTFDAQQGAFPSMPNGCDLSVSPPTAQCVATAIRQRLQDVKDLAADIDHPLPVCQPSEMTIKPGGVGDAGTSHILETYLLIYRGKAACQIRGYPALYLSGNGKPTALYSASSFMSTQPVPPLPVPLSAHNRSAWFAVNTAHACDPNGAIAVKFALPFSQTVLFTEKYGAETCRPITVSPIGALSTMLSSVY